MFRLRSGVPSLFWWRLRTETGIILFPLRSWAAKLRSVAQGAAYCFDYNGDAFVRVPPTPPLRHLGPGLGCYYSERSRKILAPSYRLHSNRCRDTDPTRAPDEVQWIWGALTVSRWQLEALQMRYEKPWPLHVLLLVPDWQWTGCRGRGVAQSRRWQRERPGRSLIAVWGSFPATYGWWREPWAAPRATSGTWLTTNAQSLAPDAARARGQENDCRRKEEWVVSFINDSLWLNHRHTWNNT